MTRRSGFFSIAVIRVFRCSEAVIDPELLELVTSTSAVQRLGPFMALKARGFERQLTEFTRRSTG